MDEKYISKLNKKIEKHTKKLEKIEDKNSYKYRLLLAKVNMYNNMLTEEKSEVSFKDKLKFNFTNQKSEFLKSELIYQKELNQINLEKTEIKKQNLIINTSNLIQKFKEKGKKPTKNIIRKNIKLTRLEAKLIRLRDNNKIIAEGHFTKYNFFQKTNIWFKNIPYENQKIIFGVLFTIPWFIGAMVFFIWPLLTTFYYSFLKLTPLQGGGFTTEFIDIENYVYAFKSYTVNSSIFIQALLDSTTELLINLPVILIFSLLIAVLLNTKFKGSTLVKAIFFIPVVFNSDVINLTLSREFGAQLQNAGSYFGALNGFKNFLMSFGIGKGLVSFLISSVDRIFTIINLSGVQILVFLAAIQSIPRNLYEAAKVEGATTYETFWKITFPMVTPIFLTALIYTIVDSFSRSTIMTFIEQARSDVNYGLGSAVAMIYMLVNIIVVAVAFLLMKGIVFYYDEK